jgi:hypothetical protein
VIFLLSRFQTARFYIPRLFKAGRFPLLSVHARVQFLLKQVLYEFLNTLDRNCDEIYSGTVMKFILPAPSRVMVCVRNYRPPNCEKGGVACFNNIIILHLDVN